MASLSEMKEAVAQAKTELWRADLMAKDLAQVLVGRLRQVSRDGNYSSELLLAKLKRELSGFNAKTGQWKD